LLIDVVAVIAAAVVAAVVAVYITVDVATTPAAASALATTTTATATLAPLLPVQSFVHPPALSSSRHFHCHRLHCSLPLLLSLLLLLWPL
jgi:hypothetical protein